MRAPTVVATANRGKMRELRAALASLELELLAQGDLGIDSAPEVGVTFVENAIAKARHASAESGFAAIADDSGLVVPALGGDPGIRSARFAGEGASDANNNAKLRDALANCQDRSAFFYCALVYLRAPDDPAPHIATAHWRGTIIDQPRGDNGFGYDPLFFLSDLGKTAAQLPLDEKNRRSHRGQASHRLAALLSASP